MGVGTHVAAPDTPSRATQILAVLGLYAIFASLLLAALWGTSRATPIAGTGHHASRQREVAVTTLLASGSLASMFAVALVLWGLCAWKA